MSAEFDREVNRKDTHSVKWEFFVEESQPPRLTHSQRSFGDNRVLPMWVADMDFRCPEEVVEALIKRAEHGIFGYSAPNEHYFQAVQDWMRRRHGWEIKREWFCLTPGVVPAINMMIQTFTQPGESVLIQPPVYHPFSMAIANNGREVVTNPLVLVKRRYQMDFEDLESKIKTRAVRMAILCHPHNPVGRVWTKEELRRFGEICLENDVLVIADEIHGDLIYSGTLFTPYALLGDAFEEKSITCTAPSKTFNLAGLHTSNIIIRNPEMRARFSQTLQRNGLTGVGAFGMVALEAAYRHGEAWLERVKAYIEENYRYLEAYIEENLPQLKVIKPEGTYLVWVDCREIGLDGQGLKKLMLDDAKVYLDEGYIFGPEGEGFERINIACPRSILQEALERIHRAVDSVLNVT